MFKIKNQFMLWCIGWAKLFDGLLEVLTFGFYSRSNTLQMAKRYAKWYHDHQSKKGSVS